ncbi:MAG: xanthine dehydrogenase family protein molybdopterin-binding subunit [Pseudomonadota bacterium]
MHPIRRFVEQTPAQRAQLPGPVNLSRRQVLQGFGGLALGVCLGPLAAAPQGAAKGSAAFEPNAFVRIDADGSVTVLAKHVEMGQGSYTGLATLVAEELDADWSRVRVEGAPADTKRYVNSLMGVQGTGGSSAMANAHEQMRRAGAAARAMLVAAAAAQWNVPASEITVENGVLRHTASGRSAGFGELAVAAGRQSVPTELRLKDPKQFKLIGKARLPRKDSADKTDGSAVFTQDVQLPDMLVAVVAHPPRFGATLKRFDAAKAKAIKGVVDVVAYEGGRGRFGGVAVLAKNTWVAQQGRDALSVEWDESRAMKDGSDAIMARFRRLADQPGTVARKAGDAEAALAKAGKRIEAEYEFPYLAHAAMEPMNCVVRLGDKSCEIWNGEQFQTIDQAGAAALLGLQPQQVAITQLYAGGSFGRRANPHSDYVLEAVAIAKAMREKGRSNPVKLVWTREDDMRAGYYRPMALHRVRAAIGDDGLPVAWQQRVVTESIMAGTPFAEFSIKNGVDNSSIEGAIEPYEIANLSLELHSPDTGVPVQWWRSVGHTHTGYVTETIIDELAAAAGKDPYAFRAALLEAHPRHLGVLRLAADKAGWGSPLKAAAGERRGRGIAVVQSFNSYVAQVAEVTVKADGRLRVDRVVCAVDCGMAVNPDVVRAQMEGGIGYGLAAVLHSAVTLQDGVVQQTNFHQYLPLRISEMPKIEVHIVPSTEPPTGVGEPGTPVIGPAVANAIFAATGKRIRRLPIADQLKT